MSMVAEQQKINGGGGISFRPNNWAALAGGICLVAVMLYMVADIGGRYLFNKPMPASFELVQVAMVFIVFLGMGYAQEKKAHLRMEALISRPGLRKTILETINLLFGLVFFALITWQAGLSALDAWRQHLEMQGIWGIPHWPGRLGFTIGALLITAQYAVDLARSLPKHKSEDFLKRGLSGS